MRCRYCRRLSVCAVLGGALLGSRPLCAQELGPTLLSYRAPEGCPGAAEFSGSVRRRSARVRLVDEGAHDRELSISMRKDGDFTIGELRLTERDGSLRQRNVRFTTCAEAVEGLALIAVVSLDPQALLQPEKPATAVALPVPQPPAAPMQAPPKGERGPAVQPSKAQLALGGELSVAFRALPAPALGGALFVDIASGAATGFAPLVRAAISHVQRRGLSSGEAEANFTLSLISVSVCPFRLTGGFLVLRPCAFVSGGALYAWGSDSAGGSDSTNLQQHTRPYGAFGGSLLLFVPVSQTVEIVADLALGATMLRDTFGFDQDQPWKTPALYLSSGLGLRFVFP
jgi:hypothetical protein